MSDFVPPTSWDDERDVRVMRLWSVLNSQISKGKLTVSTRDAIMRDCFPASSFITNDLDAAIQWAKAHPETTWRIFGFAKTMFFVQASAHPVQGQIVGTVTAGEFEAIDIGDPPYALRK